MLDVFMLTVVYAQRRKLALYTECYYAECRYGECRGAENRPTSNLLWKNNFFSSLSLASAGGRI